MSENVTVERVKWYTLARKFPQLIGRTPDGARIPGGPYTVTQAVGGVAVLAVGYYSMGLWAAFGTVGNYAALLLVTAAVVLGLGRIPLGSRNPASILLGASRAVGAPRSGRLRGRAIRIRSPHLVRHRVVICHRLGPPGAASAPAEPDELGTPAPAAQPAPAWSPRTRPAPAVEPAVATTASAPTEAPEPAEAPAPAHARRRRPTLDTQNPNPTAQLTGVQALMATVGSHPKDD